MKILCQKSQLLSGINIVSRAVSGKTTLEILQCILIEAEGNYIKLTANNTELAIDTVIEGEILIPGHIALEAKLFSEIIKRLPESEVLIETDDFCNTNIQCEQMRCDIKGLKGNDFSHLPDVSRNQEIIVSQFDFKEIIRQSIFSISNNEGNKLMTGELIRLFDNRMTAIALDGHRIAIRHIKLAESYPSTEIIVPGKTLAEIIKILPGEAEDLLNIYITDRHIMFIFGNTRVVSRLIEGKFFNISHLVSADHNTIIRVNKADMIRCLERSTLFTRESDQRPIILDMKDDYMELRISSEIGSMKDQLDYEKEGKNLTIGFNPRFIVDALRVIDEETITMYFYNDIAPCVIKDESDNYIYLILPIAIPKY